MQPHAPSSDAVRASVCSMATLSSTGLLHFLSSRVFPHLHVARSFPSASPRAAPARWSRVWIALLGALPPELTRAKSFVAALISRSASEHAFTSERVLGSTFFRASSVAAARFGISASFASPFVVRTVTPFSYRWARPITSSACAHPSGSGASPVRPTSVSTGAGGDVSGAT